MIKEETPTCPIESCKNYGKLDRCYSDSWERCMYMPRHGTTGDLDIHSVLNRSPDFLKKMEDGISELETELNTPEDLGR